MEENNLFDLKLKYSRIERSKDSNGSEKTFELIHNKLDYREKFWGFKSEKQKSIKKKALLTDKDREFIFNFISKNKFDRNHKEIIEVEKQFSFAKFTFTLEIKFKNLSVYQIQSNDLNPGHDSWKQIEKLFDSLLNFI